MKERIGGSEYGIAILRVVVGVIFAAHGAQKAFEYGIGGTSAAFDSMGIPLPGLAAVAVIAAELLGGIALALGALTRWVAVPLAITMAVAIVTVHLPAGFFAPDGVEFTLALLAGTVAILFTGPGAWALDNVIAGGRKELASGSDSAPLAAR